MKGEEAKAMKTTLRCIEQPSSIHENGRPEKRRKIDDGGIQRFFAKRDSSREEYDDDFGAGDQMPDLGEDLSPPHLVEEMGIEDKDGAAFDTNSPALISSPILPEPTPPLLTRHSNNHHKTYDTQTYICPKCGASIALVAEVEHKDWHFAKSLQVADSSVAAAASTKTTPGQQATGGSKKPATMGAKRGPKKPGGALEGKGIEEGQRKLAFGR